MPTPSPKLIIFDFDGTLFDSHAAITTSVQLTFNSLLPSYNPPLADLNRLISIGAPPEVTFKALQPQPGTDKLPDGTPTPVGFDENTWVHEYRSIYAIHGQPLTKPYPGAREVLTTLRERGFKLAIISNKAVAAVKTALEAHGLDGIVDEELIIGEPMFGGKRKPDPAGYTDVLVPRLGREFEGEVLMVGDTVTDVLFARNIGARVCWCRFGQGDAEECEREKPEFEIERLADVIGVVDALEDSI